VRDLARRLAKGPQPLGLESPRSTGFEIGCHTAHTLAQYRELRRAAQWWRLW
jgi:hypothetical protein